MSTQKPIKSVSTSRYLNAMNQPQRDPQPAPFDCRLQAIDKWIENLPRASVGKTAELIYQALQSIQMQSLKAVDRFAALEKLRETVSYITGNMSKHFHALAYPLPDKVMLIASACQSMNDYMAKGYSTVFHELQKQNPLFVDRRMLLTTMHRAITHLHQSLLTAYEIYAADHHDYWEQLYELYHYAEIHKLAHSNITDPCLTIRKKSTIKDEFLRAVLLYMAEPYHLRPGEITLANQQFEHWYELAAIEPVQEKSELEQAGLLVIELDRDHPPQFTGNSIILSDVGHCRIVNCEKLLAQLNMELDKLVEEQQGHHRPVIKKSISTGLLQRLIEAWSHSRHRRFPRQQVMAKVNVTIGLHNTHMQLMYEQYINGSARDKTMHAGFKKPKYESIEIKGINSAHMDVWANVYAWAANNTNNSPKPIPDKQDDILEYRVRQDNWTLLNNSAKGFALMSTDKHANKIQVGEIVSIQRPGAKTREIGIVRWLKAYSNTSVELGCMFLAPSAIPVGMMTEDKHSSDKVVNRGLLLPLMPVINHPESIITFSRHYRTNDIISLTQPGQANFSIKLTRRIADNDTISQFLFTRIAHQLPENKPDESSAEIDLRRYTDVWQNL